jgi:hypothetical protein
MSTQALTIPKPKEHGAWGMLYIPMVIAIWISGAWNARVLLMALAVTLIFLSQRPYTQLLTSKRLRQDGRLWQRNLTWLSIYWIASGTLIAVLYFHYGLRYLLQFTWIGVPIAAAFSWCLKNNRMRTVAGELVGICGLTLSAPLVHYASVGQVRVVGFGLWGLCILYFASSVFYLKAVIANCVKARSRSLVDPIYTRLCGSYHFGLLVLIAGLAVLDRVPGILVLAFLPVIARGLLGIQRPQTKLNFARIGWTEVGYSLFFALVTSLAIRGMNSTMPL